MEIYKKQNSQRHTLLAENGRDDYRNSSKLATKSMDVKCEISEKS